MATTAAAPSHSFLGRALGTALCRSNVYDEVKRDPWGTVQAALIVVLVASLSASTRIVNRPWLIVVFAAVAIAFWAFEAEILYVVARFWVAPSVLQGKRACLLRTLGFAGTPALLAAVLIDSSHPQWFIVFFGVWGVVASVVAVRQALGVSTGRAITISITAIIGFIDIAVLISLIGLGLLVALFVR
jgi:hypothetical protein